MSAGALCFESGAGIPDSGTVRVMRWRSHVDGDISAIGGPLHMPGWLVRSLEPGRDEILIASGPNGRLQIWGRLATGLSHDRVAAHRRWRPYRWT